MRSALLPLALAAATLVAGCAAQGPFPSLAPRAVEREFAEGVQPVPPCLLPGAEASEAPTPPAPPPQAARDPVLTARIEQLIAAARQGDRAFDEAAAAAAAAVSSAGTAGSESWIDAQLALSRAETARAPTTSALADLTALALEEATQTAHPLDQQAVEAATAEVRALADRQTARLESLKDSLSAL